MKGAFTPKYYSPIDNINKLTISFWVKSFKNNITWSPFFRPSSSVYARISYGGVPSLGSVYSNKRIEEGKWHYIVMSNSGTETAIYIDGVETGRGTHLEVTYNTDNWWM